MQPTPEQALEQLYVAARLAPLTADQHEHLRKCANVLADVIKPKPQST